MYKGQKYTIQKNTDDGKTNKVFVNDEEKKELESFVREFLKEVRGVEC